MPKSILDPDFRYVPSAQTDLRKTFARLRKEQRAEVVQRIKQPPTNVTPIVKK